MDSLVPHFSVAIHPDEREHQFKETLSFHAKHVDHQRRLGVASLVVGAAGLIVGLAGVGAVIVMLPLKQTVVKFVTVDSSTGWVGEAVGARDAPKMFNERVAHQYLRQYLEAREGYNPIDDQRQWDTVKAMSSADEFENYNAWRKSELAPVKQLGSNGHVDITNFSFSKPIHEKNDTWSYTVRYQRREVKGQNVSQFRPWHADIEFQWHPEMTQSEPDSEVNAGGMQVLPGYRAEQDPP